MHGPIPSLHSIFPGMFLSILHFLWVVATLNLPLFNPYILLFFPLFSLSQNNPNIYIYIYLHTLLYCSSFHFSSPLSQYNSNVTPRYYNCFHVPFHHASITPTLPKPYISPINPFKGPNNIIPTLPLNPICPYESLNPIDPYKSLEGTK